MDKTLSTKLFMEAFYKYVADNNIELNDQNIQDYLHEFMAIYNEERKLINAGKAPKSDEEKISDLLDEARMCDYKEAKGLVRKALKINPDNIDAQLFMIHLENEPVFQIEAMINLKNKEKQRIENYERETECEIDNYYLDLEGRDYLHILFELCQTYQICGMYGKALEIAHEAIQLDDNDHVGFHRDLIALHLHLEKWDAMPSLLEGYLEKSAEGLLFESIYAYKQGDLRKAKNVIEDICKFIPEVLKLFVTKNLSSKTIGKVMESDNAYEIEDFMGILKEYSYLFTEEGYLNFMQTVMINYKKANTKKRTKRVLN